MPEVNADIPAFNALLRAELMYQEDPGKVGQFIPVRVFGLCSIPGRCLTFHVMDDLGACIWRVPIHKLCTAEGAPITEVAVLQLWDCFSPKVTVNEYDHLYNRVGQVLLSDKTTARCRYRFTVDWYGNAYSEDAGEQGHKCGHVVELDDGRLACMPNNRLIWADAAGIPEPFKRLPDYKIIEQVWTCEGEGKFVTEDTDRMFYEVEDARSLRKEQKRRKPGRYS